MTLNDTVQALEQIVLCRPLTPSERHVLLQSFEGCSYKAMSQETNYVAGYLKIVGSKLWQELSVILGQKITKKNIQAVLEAYLHNRTEWQVEEYQQPVRPALASQVARLDGPVPVASPFYIERPPLEAHAYQEIARPGCLLRLRAPSRYGKSSLLLRLIDYSLLLGVKPVVLDFQEADRSTLKCLDQLLRWVCANFMHQLGLTADLDGVWDPELGSKLSCKAFLQEQVLTPSETPIILMMNEVNRVFEFSEVARDFLSLIRACYEQAQGSDVWSKLRLVMAYSTDVYVPLQLSQSPFNVGMPLTLLPFNLGQVTELAQRYQLSFTAEQMAHLMRLLGGQPHLFNLAFYSLSTQTISLPDLISSAPTLSGIYRNHLQHYLALLLEQPTLLAAFGLTLDGTQVELEPTATYQLISMGLVSLEGHRVRISCQLYRDFFKHAFSHNPMESMTA